MGGCGVGILWAGLRVVLTQWKLDDGWYSYVGMEVRHKQSHWSRIVMWKRKWIKGWWINSWGWWVWRVHTLHYGIQCQWKCGCARIRDVGWRQHWHYKRQDVIEGLVRFTGCVNVLHGIPGDVGGCTSGGELMECAPHLWEFGLDGRSICGCCVKPHRHLKLVSSLINIADQSTPQTAKESKLKGFCNCLKKVFGQGMPPSHSTSPVVVAPPAIMTLPPTVTVLPTRCFAFNWSSTHCINDKD